MPDMPVDAAPGLHDAGPEQEAAEYGDDVDLYPHARAIIRQPGNSMAKAWHRSRTIKMPLCIAIRTRATIMTGP